MQLLCSKNIVQYLLQLLNAGGHVTRNIFANTNILFKQIGNSSEIYIDFIGKAV